MAKTSVSFCLKNHNFLVLKQANMYDLNKDNIYMVSSSPSGYFQFIRVMYVLALNIMNGKYKSFQKGFFFFFFFFFFFLCCVKQARIHGIIKRPDIGGLRF